MRFKKLTIRDFGKLHNVTVGFEPGINVICGENESGKSTVHTFIQSMLYGLKRQRGRRANRDTYTICCPWENPASYGGILWLESGGSSYRISRNFYKETASDSLLCEDTGEEEAVENSSMNRILGGVSEAVYENTVSVAQLKSAAGTELARELQNYMAGLGGAGDRSLNLTRTMQRLKMTRKGFQSQAERQRRELSEEEKKLVSNISFLHRETEDLKGRRENLLSQKEKLYPSKEDDRHTLLNDQLQKAKNNNAAVTVTMILMAAAAAVGAAFLWKSSGKVFYSAAAAAAGIILIAVLGSVKIRLRRRIEKYRRLQKKLASKEEKINWSLESLNETDREKRTALSNLNEELREIRQQRAMPLEAEKETEAVNLAMETIEKLSLDIHSRIGTDLSKRTSEILSEITGGKYREVFLDSNLQVRVNTEERIVRPENLSRGTVEQIYFALRMAAGELLCGEEIFPVFLDETFASYDTERLRSALEWLARQNRQVILTSCHDRETELLDEMGIPYNKILLN